MTEPSIVRTATPRELDAITTLDGRCFDRPWSSSSWEAELAAGAVFALGRPLLAVACAPIVIDRCELRRIAVDPRARRAGYGRDLLTHVMEQARLRGCAKVELEVGASNRAALGLYGALGFVVVGRRRGYYSSPPDDAVLMDLPLGERSSQGVD